MLKNIFLLIFLLCTAIFALGAIFAMINFLIDWHIGNEGAASPADPIAAAVFVILAGISGGIAFLLTRNSE